MAYPAVLAYRDLTRTHPDFDEKFWRRCRALYAGGRRLLGDDQVMSDVFPPHAAEAAHLYAERKKRAFYLPYPGEIVDAIVASLTSKPLSLLADPELTGEAEEFYQEFFQDCSRSGGKTCSVNHLLREQILHALQCRTAWTLVDLPAGEVNYASAAEQRAAGALRAYACCLAPEAVRDWEEDDTGELEWVLIRTEIRRRRGLDASRDKVEETFRYFDRAGWAEYQITYPEGNPPNEGALVPLVGEGRHAGSGAGKVPVVRLTLPEGLYALGKIESIAVAHFNTRCALSWAQTKTLMPVPIAYLQGIDPLNSTTENESRATGQVHSPSHIRVLAEKDRLEYFAPDAAPFATAQADLSVLRDEMHRVLHHMALSVDNSGAALQRSAESKAIDQAVAAVVLAALGGYLREHAIEIYRLVTLARGDGEVKWTAKGMEDFDDTTSSALIDQAVNLAAVDIPSGTFQAEFKFQIAKKLLGADADEEMLQTIRDELTQALTQETVTLGLEQRKADVEATRASARPDPEDEDPEGGAGR